jgi:predicted lipid-binding transport protein (Tim44 family)
MTSDANIDNNAQGADQNQNWMSWGIEMMGYPPEVTDLVENVGVGNLFGLFTATGGLGAMVGGGSAAGGMADLNGAQRGVLFDTLASLTPDKIDEILQPIPEGATPEQMISHLGGSISDLKAHINTIPGMTDADKELAVNTIAGTVLDAAGVDVKPEMVAGLIHDETLRAMQEQPEQITELLKSEMGEEKFNSFTQSPAKINEQLEGTKETLKKTSEHIRSMDRNAQHYMRNFLADDARFDTVMDSMQGGLAGGAIGGMGGLAIGGMIMSQLTNNPFLMIVGTFLIGGLVGTVAGSFTGNKLTEHYNEKAAPDAESSTEPEASQTSEADAEVDTQTAQASGTATPAATAAATAGAAAAAVAASAAGESDDAEAIENSAETEIAVTTQAPDTGAAQQIHAPEGELATFIDRVGEDNIEGLRGLLANENAATGADMLSGLNGDERSIIYKTLAELDSGKVDELLEPIPEGAELNDIISHLGGTIAGFKEEINSFEGWTENEKSMAVNTIAKVVMTTDGEPPSESEIAKVTSSSSLWRMQNMPGMVAAFLDDETKAQLQDTAKTNEMIALTEEKLQLACEKLGGLDPATHEYVGEFLSNDANYNALHAYLTYPPAADEFAGPDEDNQLAEADTKRATPTDPALKESGGLVNAQRGLFSGEKVAQNTVASDAAQNAELDNNARKISNVPIFDIGGA